jgi:hypothetical protein
MIRFCCPFCGKSLKAKEEFVGRKGRCTGCASVYAIPAPGCEAATEAVQPDTRRETELAAESGGWQTVTGAAAAAAAVAARAVRPDEPALRACLRERARRTRSREIELKWAAAAPKSGHSAGRSESRRLTGLRF